MYSFNTSFCTVPDSLRRLRPAAEPPATIHAKPKSTPSGDRHRRRNFRQFDAIEQPARCMSSMESIATPTLPTSPVASGLSESESICVGRSKRHDKPSSHLPAGTCNACWLFRHSPMPAYWRIVQRAPVHRCLHATREWKIAGCRCRGYSPILRDHSECKEVAPECERSLRLGLLGFGRHRHFHAVVIEIPA